ncbi:hypothetical protein EYF80_002661 [Liparis tanakae]|uniref:Uncharacterized protein n=1 Tax=Liparis tanakae TaxID=230148 RepID=A0A4Z2J9L0_9TELE|nr:hypothetical protein EYF80_002661 [Liparis tanakae]
MEKALEGKLREKNKQRVVKTLVGKKERGRWIQCGKCEKNNNCRNQKISSYCEGDTGLPKEESELSLAAENSRLRGELDRMRRQQTAQTRESLPVEEKLSLLNKLETAEARVQTLEAQHIQQVSLAFRPGCGHLGSQLLLEAGVPSKFIQRPQQRYRISTPPAMSSVMLALMSSMDSLSSMSRLAKTPGYFFEVLSS